MYTKPPISTHVPATCVNLMRVSAEGHNWRVKQCQCKSKLTDKQRQFNFSGIKISDAIRNARIYRNYYRLCNAKCSNLCARLTSTQATRDGFLCKIELRRANNGLDN